MAKLFKNGKQILALVIAFAVIAVSLFAGSIVASAETTDSLCKGTRIEYWDGTQSNQFAKGKGSVDEPYIIENAQQLNYVCTVADTASEGKFYKVDPEIKAFILQPQAVVTALGGDNVFIDVASAAATKELFEVKAAGQSLKNWLQNGTNKVFAGNFDGSGVAIYGLYANDALKASQQCALFPILDGNGPNLPDGDITETPTVIKNFALKNSYFKGIRRVGAISATAWYAAGGTKVNGFVEAEYIEVANCFIIGQDLKESDNTLHGNNAANPIAEMGIAFGSMGNDTVKLRNSSIYGNDSEYRVYGTANSTTYKVNNGLKFNRVFAGNTFGNTNPACGEFHNSIALDVIVNSMQANNDEHIYVSNVYTNVATTQKGVTVLENSGYGAEGQAAMSAFDWEKDWFMGQYGPTFRAFHGEINLVQTNKAHYYACDDCGLMSYGGEEKHIYDVANVDDDYICTVCGYQCYHNVDYDLNEEYEGDCVTPAGVYFECYDCGRVKVEGFGAPGHTLEWVDEIYADCENTGRQGYWHCTVCDSNFTADSEEAAKWAAMDTSIADPDTELIIPKAPHNATNRADGSIRVYAEGANGHYWICYTCEGRLEAVEDKDYAEEGKLKKHKYEDSVCVDCGWECTEHNYEATGTVAVAGSCTVDREEEIKCTICGDKKSVVTEKAGHKIVKIAEVAATDKLEGTKEHYKCSVCQEIYIDAEGKTKATAADLVIAKKLPAEYENIVVDGTINTDSSNKSPATSDSFASVLAVAALAGVAFVALRKVR